MIVWVEQSEAAEFFPPRHYRCFVLRSRMVLSLPLSFFSSLLFFLLLFSFIGKKKKRSMSRRFYLPHLVLRGGPTHDPTNFPPSAPFFLRSLPSRVSAPLEPPRRNASPFQGGNSVGGKVIRPLATKSFLADSCFIILRPASTRGNSVGFLSLFLSTLLSPSSPPFTMTARASSFQSSSVSTSDRCVSRPGKIAMDIITRRDVVAN